MKDHHSPEIPKSVHYTEEADSYHMDKCVSKTMSRMSDPMQCIAYMAGIAEGNPAMANVSIADLRAHCAAKESSFTIAHAEDLCKGLNAAHSTFWSDKDGDATAADLQCKPLLLGTTTCGWTQKQLVELGEHKDQVEVVMCDQSDDARCQGVESVPMWQFCDGTSASGFHEMSKLPL